jgi:quinol monooxygenase YgiN
MNAQFVIAVDLVIDDASLADFMPLMEENARASRHGEPGCRRFDVCTDGEDPAKVFLYEIYEDEAAFASHLASPHYQAFDTATREMIVSKTVRRYWLRAE